MPNSAMRLFEHRLHFVLLVHVRLNRQRLDAALAGFLRHGFCGLRVRDVINHHIRARVRERNGHGQADARVGAGDDGRLAGQHLRDRMPRQHAFRQVLAAQIIIHHPRGVGCRCQ